jgi:hypothetical protein
MEKALAVVSDLHLGALPALDDFALDERFEILLARLGEARFDDCELVLLGDTFDAWQAVDAAECTSELIPEGRNSPPPQRSRTGGSTRFARGTHGGSRLSPGSLSIRSTG